MADVVLQCGTVTTPYTIDQPSGNFGIPMRGDANRNGKTIKAILIRCIPEGYNEPCAVEGNLAKNAETYRESYHYVIKSTGQVIRDVPETQASWALKPFYNVPDNCPVTATLPFIEYPECCKILWTPNTNLIAGEHLDDIILSIGIEVPASSANFGQLDWAHSGCVCKPVLSSTYGSNQITALARVLQYLFKKYPAIPKTPAGLQFYHNINLCEINECGCAPSPEEAICLATQYCEPVPNRAGSAEVLGTIEWFYGFDINGLPVKEKATTLLARLP